MDLKKWNIIFTIYMPMNNHCVFVTLELGLEYKSVLFSITIFTSINYENKIIEINQLLHCILQWCSHFVLVMNPAHPIPLQSCAFSLSWKPKLTLSHVVTCLVQLTIIRWAVVWETHLCWYSTLMTLQQYLLPFYIPNKNDHYKTHHILNQSFYLYFI